jgi:UDP-3-O-[3-hydroxymyristoyl] N-acetylglucosamine deacetylase
MLKQKTIAQECSFEGIGVHSGKKVKVILGPASENHGITIASNFAPGEKILLGTIIPEETRHATVLRQGQLVVSTIEHLLAAIHALQIDNIEIRVEGMEIPILDGSALPFVQGIIEAGFFEQAEKKEFLMPISPLEIRDEEGREIVIAPVLNGEKRLSFDYGVCFEHPLAGAGELKVDLDSEIFKEKIAPARTFGFLAQLSILRKYGLAKGASLGNTVVIGENEILNELRFEDEFVRHKLLDLIGDLACLGKPLIGSVRARKTGHSFNKKVVEHFINNPKEWVIV